LTSNYQLSSIRPTKLTQRTSKPVETVVNGLKQSISISCACQQSVNTAILWFLIKTLELHTDREA